MSEEQNPMVITFIGLRRAVGWLGIVLPFVLAIGLMIMNSCSIQDSISQYYYTRMGSYLIGTLCAVGLFLFAYKGYPGENDGKWCNFAAICAFGIAFIPMQLNSTDNCVSNSCIVFFTNGKDWWRVFHFIFAALFFATTAYLSYFKFTKTTEGHEIKKGEKKYSRNLIYRICGVIIIVCILILLVYNIMVWSKTDFHICMLTFFMESVSVMLIAFGTSWLVKGEGIKYFND
jgi:hypothetical protein